MGFIVLLIFHCALRGFIFLLIFDCATRTLNFPERLSLLDSTLRSRCLSVPQGVAELFCSENRQPAWPSRFADASKVHVRAEDAARA